MLETLEAQGILTLPPIKENMVRKPAGKPVCEYPSRTPFPSDKRGIHEAVI